jgi:hypothetical protein
MTPLLAASLNPQLPTTAALAALWDDARDLPAPRRAQLLLRLGYPGLPAENIAALPLGARDGLLLRLRRLLFGDEIEAVVQCPSCGETATTSFASGELVTDSAVDAAVRQAGAEARLEVQGWRIGYRLPAVKDALTLAGEPDSDARRLVELCITEAVHLGAPSRKEAIPEVVLSAIAAEMLQADPNADLLLDMACPACSRQWSVGFDVPAYLWMEVRTWARRNLREVAVLARAFGWSEAEIMAMSPVRRGDYLDLVSA